MKMPPYIRGVIDIFSSGKRTAFLVGFIGLAIVAISLTASFESHVNAYNYYGPLFTANIWTYIGIILLLIAIFAFVGDVRYAALQQKEQEIEGGLRLRSAEESLENSLRANGATSENGDSGAVRGQTVADDMLALSVLWQVTNARLNQYHRIATGQARRSFTTAQVAIVFGFLLLAGFAALSFRTHSTASSITIAALGAVAAALSGYIGRTFIRSQETAARYLRAYFGQPLEFSRYLAAERLLSSQAGIKVERRDELLQIIITAMVENTEARVISESGGDNDQTGTLRNLLKAFGEQGKSELPANDGSEHQLKPVAGG